MRGDRHLTGRWCRCGLGHRLTAFDGDEATVDQQGPPVAELQGSDHLDAGDLIVDAVARDELVLGIEGAGHRDALPLVLIGDGLIGDVGIGDRWTVLVRDHHGVGALTLLEPTQLPLSEVDEGDAQNQHEDQQAQPAEIETSHHSTLGGRSSGRSLLDAGVLAFGVAGTLGTGAFGGGVMHDLGEMGSSLTQCGSSPDEHSKGEHRQG